MHPVDVLSYGNATVLRAVSDLPAADWDTAGVCGWWSVREIVAHLASFEHIPVSYTHLDVYKRQVIELMVIEDAGDTPLFAHVDPPDDIIGPGLFPSCLLYTSRCV